VRKVEAATAVEQPAARTTERAWKRAADRIGLDGGLAIVCACVALAVNLFHLGSASVWMDESYSVALARAPYSVLFAAFTSGGEPNMILYHILLHVWLQVTGWLGLPTSETLVRLPSALCATLCAPLVFLLGRRTLGRAAGLAAAVVFLLNPLELTHAQEVRGYALQVLLVCVAWYALVAALSRSTDARGWWLIFTAASVLGVYAHAFTLLILLAQVTACGLLLFIPTSWRDNARRNLWPMGISLASILVLIAPLLYVSRSGSKTGWLPAPDVSSLLSHYAGVLAGRGGRAAVIGLVALVGVGILGVAGYPFLRRSGRLRELGATLRRAEERPQPAAAVLVVLLTWLLVPIVLSYVISQGPTRLFSSRYLVVVVPSAGLLLGFAISLIRIRAGQLVAAGLAVCAALLFVPSYYAHAQVEDWRGPTRWLEQTYQPGDGLVCYNNVQGCQLAVNYYLVTDHSAASFDDSPGAIHLERFGHSDPFAEYTAALDPQALSAYGAAHPHLFFIAGRFADASDAARTQAVATWLDCRYHFVAQTSSAVVTIRLYEMVPAPTGSSNATCPMPPAPTP
jgi:4-amino-4-deoxy-L-arabinose transferase-like glycosyltransferase